MSLVATKGDKKNPSKKDLTMQSQDDGKGGSSSVLTELQEAPNLTVPPESAAGSEKLSSSATNSDENLDISAKSAGGNDITDSSTPTGDASDEATQKANNESDKGQTNAESKGCVVGWVAKGSLASMKETTNRGYSPEQNAMKASAKIDAPAADAPAANAQPEKNPKRRSPSKRNPVFRNGDRKEAKAALRKLLPFNSPPARNTKKLHRKNNKKLPQGARKGPGGRWFNKSGSRISDELIVKFLPKGATSGQFGRFVDKDGEQISEDRIAAALGGWLQEPRRRSDATTAGDLHGDNTAAKFQDAIIQLPSQDGSVPLQEGIVTRNRSRSEGNEDEPRKKYPFRRASGITYEPESSEENDDDDEEDAEEDVKAKKKTQVEKKRPWRQKSESKRSSKRQKRSSKKGEAIDNIETSNQTLEDMPEDEQLEIKRALKRGSIPSPASPGYKAYKEWQALRRPSLKTTSPAPAPFIASTLHLFTSKAERNLQTLYHLIRSHLARGQVWQAIQCCHSMLKSAYAMAAKGLPKLWKPRNGHLIDFGYPVELQMQELREKIAGMWCLYAHVFLQVSETDLFLSISDNRFEGATRGLASLNSMEDSLWDQAIAILASCSSCPFVGNHAAITLTLSRLRLRQRKRGILRPYRTPPGGDASRNPTKAKGTAVYFDRSASTKAHWGDNLERALAICKAGIKRSAPTPSYRTKRSSPQKVSCDQGFGELYLDMKATTERAASIVARIVSGSCTGNGMESDYADPACQPNLFLDVLDLPRLLEAGLLKAKGRKEGSFGLPYLFADRQSTRLLLMETNCLDRLKAALGMFDDEANGRLVLLCDPERLKSNPQKPQKDNKQMSCVDGVAWDDCLYFQSMTGAFVEESTARKSWYIQQHRLSFTADFFRAGTYHANASIKDDEEIDGFATFPSDPVYSDVSFPCPKCTSLLGSQADVKSHVEKCAGSGRRRFRQDTLHLPWDDLASKRKPGCIASVRSSIDSGIKCFDLQCVCKDCCVHDQLYEDINDQGEGTCWSQHADDFMDDGDAEILGNDTYDESDINIMATNSSENPTHENFREKSTSLCNAVDRSASDAVAAAAKPQSDKQADDAGMGTKEGGKGSARKRKRKSSQRKRSINADLTGLFEDEAWGEKEAESDYECVVVDMPPDQNGNIHPVEDKLTEVEYPCRTCRQSSFSSKAQRDEHESGCKGPSGSCMLEERWPTFSSNFSSPRRQVDKLPKPSAEDPTPTKLRKTEGRTREPVYGVNGVSADETKNGRNIRSGVDTRRSKAKERLHGHNGFVSASDNSGNCQRPSLASMPSPLSEKNSTLVVS